MSNQRDHLFFKAIIFAFIVTSFMTLPAHAAIISLIANLDTAQEPAVDPATPGEAFGTATVTYDDVTNELSWNITFSGLSGDATAAHFHGPAAPGANASPVVNIGAISGLVSPLTGDSFVIAETEEADLLAGQWYINIHTALNTDGEIRGQVLPTASLINFISLLDRNQELTLDPTTPTTAAGSAAITYDPDSNLLMWNLNFGGLSGPATLAHFHGPAAPGANAGPVVNIGDISGLESPSIGSAVIDEAVEPDLLNGLWYTNIHTTLNPGGEIRGQVLDSSTVLSLNVTLEPGQEPSVDPATPPDALGNAALTYDPNSNLLMWNVSFGGLSGPATLAHFHGPATPGNTAPPQVDIGALSGLESPMIGSSLIDDTQEIELLDELWYINVHTDLNPAGEIRGQVVFPIFEDQFEDNDS